MRLLTASQLEPLADCFVARVCAAPLAPLEREVVVVARSLGLRDWLEEHFARRLGCAASLQIVSPRQIVDALAGAIVPVQRGRFGGDTAGFSRNGLRWRLGALLPTLPTAPPFDALHRYAARVGADGPRLLADRLARLYDDYQVYRPDVLAAWADGRPHPDDHAHAAWQGALWQRLRAGHDAPDRATQLEALVQRLEAEGPPPDGLPARVTVFGALLFPPLYLRVLAALGRHADVSFLAVLPEGASQNALHPLRAALAERSREFGRVLASLPGRPEPEPVPCPEAPPPATALAALQADLAQDRVRTPSDRFPLAAADRSLRVHDVHSPLREVEVLRDELLDAFRTLPGLRPDDVLVVVPDLDLYAPLVDAVLGGEGALRVPYHVAGHPNGPARRVLDAAVRALGLARTRCTAADVLDLLAEPVFRRRAGLSDDALALIRDGAARAHVRWGRDAAHKSGFGLPPDDVHTWQHGLDRLMLGYAVGAGVALVDGRAPLDGVPDADALGRFAEWAAALFDHADRAATPRPLEAWAAVVTDALDQLALPHADEEHAALRHLREAAAALPRLAPPGAPRVGIPFDEVLAVLQAAAAQYEPDGRALTGRVTVCDPILLRHAPHRVVAFLGLNDGAFPAVHDEDPLDLIAVAPRDGDPHPRRTERQLFLDAILAAREQLILLYVGRDERDNGERAASPVLEELLRCCDATFQAEKGRPAREHLVVPHRLQPFHTAYFDREGPLFTYAAQHRVDVEAKRDAPPPFWTGALPTPDAPDAPRDADALAHALANPSRAFCRHRLGLRLEGADEPLLDDEALHLGDLAAFKLKDLILDGLHRGLAPSAIAALLRAQGALPPGALGAAWIAAFQKATEPLAARLAALPGGRPREVAVPLEDGAVLAARLPYATDSTSLVLRAGKIDGKAPALLRAWVLHLAFLIEGGADADRTTILAGTDGAVRFGPVPDPAHQLTRLLKAYRCLLDEPPPLFAGASLAFAQEEHKGKPLDAAVGTASRKYQLDWQGFGDLKDPYVALCFRGRAPIAAEAFPKWARALWTPILQARQDA